MEKILKVSELINEDFIIDIKSDNKKDAINELLEVICKNHRITDCKIFSKEIFKREELKSSGVDFIKDEIGKIVLIPTEIEY